VIDTSASRSRFAEPVDEARLERRRAHERGHAERRGMARQGEHRAVVELRVLAVDDREVEAGRANDLDALEGRQLHERAEERRAPAQALAETRGERLRH
jgi:hypothetical protein